MKGIPRISDRVLYIPGGVVNQSTEFRAAFITQTGMSGLTLNVINPYSKEFYTYRGVRHYQDQWLDEHQDARQTNGAWMSREEYERFCQDQEKAVQAKALAAKIEQEKRTKVAN